MPFINDMIHRLISIKRTIYVHLFEIIFDFVVYSILRNKQKNFEKINLPKWTDMPQECQFFQRKKALIWMKRFTCDKLFFIIYVLFIRDKCLDISMLITMFSEIKYMKHDKIMGLKLYHHILSTKQMEFIHKYYETNF